MTTARGTFARSTIRSTTPGRPGLPPASTRTAEPSRIIRHVARPEDAARRSLRQIDQALDRRLRARCVPLQRFEVQPLGLRHDRLGYVHGEAREEPEILLEAI